MVINYLITDLYNDGSVNPASSSNWPLLNVVNKTKFLSYNQYTNLQTKITTGITQSNIYQTIENVSDYAKSYVLSNIPPINTQNFVELLSIMFTVTAEDSNLANIFQDIANNNSEEFRIDTIASIYTYSANWYLSQLSNDGVYTNQDMLETYPSIIYNYINTQNFSNI